jgi:hypothetical protein
MNRWRNSLVVMALAFMVGGAATCAFGQAAGGQGNAGGQGPGGQGQGGRRGGGNFDPAQARQRMMDRMKQQLEASDDEWNALQPKIDKVMTLQRDARFGGGGFRGRGGGRGGNNPGGNNPGGNNPAANNNPNQPQSAVAKAAQELRTTLEDKSASPDAIKSKLTALRDAREKARGDLAAAQKELKEVLTQRQEAVLVESGFLE